MNRRQRARLPAFKAQHAKKNAAARERLLRSAGLSFGCNVLYALYHGALGILQLSMWFVAMSAFYGLLSVLRFEIILCAGNRKKTNSDVTETLLLKSSGVLLVLLSVILAWVNAICIVQKIGMPHGKITMITIATYTFGKIAASITQTVRQRKAFSTLSVVLCRIRQAEVAASVLTLQQSMLVSFGTVEERQICRMNAVTGAAICLFILLLGIRMITQTRKENDVWQNQNL